MKKMNTLNGIFDTSRTVHRKNFIKENVRQLREMQNCWQTREENIGKLPKSNRFKNVLAKVPPHVIGSGSKFKEPHLYSEAASKCRLTNSAQPVHCSQSNATSLLANVPHHCTKSPNQARKGTTGPKTRKVSGCESAESLQCPMSAPNSRHMGCQTLDPSNMDKLEREGVIRYPSSRRSPKKIRSPIRRSTTCDMGLQTELAKSPKRVATEPKPLSGRLNSNNSAVVDKKSNIEVEDEDETDFKDVPNCELDKTKPGPDEMDVNFIKLNALAAMASRPRSSNQAQLDPLRPPPNYQKGVIPKYLKERQDEWQKKTATRLQETPDPFCPVGHVPLPDEERKETLRMLRKSYADLIQELNMMPVRTDTLRMRQRKIALEKQLNKLEEGIKVFSRPKVFVKIGA